MRLGKLLRCLEHLSDSELAPLGEDARRLAVDRIRDVDVLGHLEVRLASGGTFGVPTPIAELDAAAFDNQPSITPDGKTLYFSRRNAMNVYDIWFATRR